MPCNSHKTKIIPPSYWLIPVWQEQKLHPIRERARGRLRWCTRKYQRSGRSRLGCTYLLWLKDPHCQCTPISSTRDPSRAGGDEETCRGGRVTGGGGKVASHHQPDSWARWPQKPGHLCWEGRSQLTRSSDLLWEARLPGRNSCGLGKWRSPGNTDQGQWQFVRSTSFKRVQSSLFGNSPSHS